MNNLRTKIQSQFADDYTTNLDSFSDNDLRDIDNYLKELNSSGHIHNISNLSKDEQKIEVEVKSGTTYIRK